MTVTVDQIRKSKFSLVVALDGDFYRNVYRCDDFPRLVMVRTGPSRRRPGAHERRWIVDGVDCPTLEAVAAALNQPPRKGAAEPVDEP